MADVIVPFGKYKGQPVEVMAQDRAYVEWLTAQPWFVEKFQNIYTIVVNNFQEPAETPAHNALQIRFLDAGFRARVAAFLGGQVGECGPEFEIHGFDVALPLDRGTRHIECKPSIGDDYPAVLRQIKAACQPMPRTTLDPYPGPIYDPVLLVGQYTGQGATEDQFIEFFKASGVTVIFLDEVDS